MKTTKTKIHGARTYKNLVLSPFLVLRDEAPKENMMDMLEPNIQVKYMNDMVGRFLKVFIKLYGHEELSDADRDKLRRYLEKIIDAKDAVTPREPKGGMYLRKY